MYTPLHACLTYSYHFKVVENHDVVVIEQLALKAVLCIIVILICKSLKCTISFNVNAAGLQRTVTPCSHAKVVKLGLLILLTISDFFTAVGEVCG